VEVRVRPSKFAFLFSLCNHNICSILVNFVARIFFRQGYFYKRGEDFVIKHGKHRCKCWNGILIRNASVLALWRCGRMIVICRSSKMDCGCWTPS
jgi:hypothetical protein